MDMPVSCTLLMNMILSLTVTYRYFTLKCAFAKWHGFRFPSLILTWLLGTTCQAVKLEVHRGMGKHIELGQAH